MNETKLMAVWKYDNPPYYLVGEITDWFSDGTVSVKGYYGMRIRPIKVLPYDQVKVDALSALREKYYEDVKDICKTCKTKAEILLYIE